MTGDNEPGSEHAALQIRHNRRLADARATVIELEAKVAAFEEYTSQMLKTISDLEVEVTRLNTGWHKANGALLDSRLAAQPDTAAERYRRLFEEACLDIEKLRAAIQGSSKNVKTIQGGKA